VIDSAARERTHQPDALRCAVCDARLAHDQRYCVECGVRRGSLPARITELIAGMLERGRSSVPIPAGPARRLAGAPPNWIPTSRAAAIAVMGILAFGVAVGSAANEPVVGNASQGSPLILLREAAAAAATTTTGGGGGGGGGGGSSKSTPSSTNNSSTASSTSSTSGGGGSSSNTGGGGNPFGLPPIKHVFLIVLSGQGYNQTFGSSDPYLSKTLGKHGEVLAQYYGVAQGSLANGVAIISGQGPTPQTAANCPRFTGVAPATKGKQDQVIGQGCVYPASTETLFTQLTAKHDTWKAYIEGIGDGPKGQAKTCRRPVLGHADLNQSPSAHDPYVTWRNPVVYFKSDTAGTTCAKSDVGLEQLTTDLKSASTTPNFSYIVPDPCHDGSDQPCTPKAKSGVAAADTFLRTVVPEIEKSPAYKADGLLLITVDQAPQTGPHSDSTSCCVTVNFPNMPVTPTAPTATTTTTPGPTSTTPTTTTSTTTTTGLLGSLPSLLSTSTTATTTITTPPPTTTTGTTTTTTTTTPGAGPATPPGGGQVGMVLLSQYVKPGTIDLSDQYSHFSLLASLENLFGLKHLGYAGFSGMLAFDAATYNAYHG
jgi:phosphatidylinositol-3-phosphatase